MTCTAVKGLQSTLPWPLVCSLVDSFVFPPLQNTPGEAGKLLLGMSGIFPFFHFLPPDDNSASGCSDRLAWALCCIAVSELRSTAASEPADTQSEATVGRPPSLPSGRTAGEPADTGWKEPAGRRSAGRKYFG